MAEDTTEGEYIEKIGRLKQQLYKKDQKIEELEEKLEEQSGNKGQSSDEVSGMLKVIEQKDKTLEKYARELEENNEKLQETVDELEKKNRELETSTATLRLYEKIFETDPNVLIGVDENLSIVHFNQSAVDYIGDQMHEYRFAPVNMLPEEKFGGMDLASALRATLTEQESHSVEFTSPDEEVPCKMRITPIENEEGGTQAGLIRIHIASSEIAQ